MLRVLVFIQQNLDRELTLDELAGVAHFSPYHFHRIFGGMVGESVKAHIRRIRLERAAMRLKHSREPVTRIALEAGYRAHAAFTRAFRDLTGLSPTAYRARKRPLPPSGAPSGVHFSPDRPPDAFNPLTQEDPAMDVQIRRFEPQRVAFTRQVGPYDEVGRAWDALCPPLGAQGLLGADTSMIGLCYDDPEVTPPEKIRYDACVTVDDDFPPTGEIGVQTIPGGEFAVTTHQGPYHTLGETYSRLFGQWLPRSGRTSLSAPCHEVYLNDPEGTEPAELLTEIRIPLEPTR